MIISKINYNMSVFMIITMNSIFLIIFHYYKYCYFNLFKF